MHYNDVFFHCDGGKRVAQAMSRLKKNSIFQLFCWHNTSSSSYDGIEITYRDLSAFCCCCFSLTTPAYFIPPLFLGLDYWIVSTHLQFPGVILVFLYNANIWEGLFEARASKQESRAKNHARRRKFSHLELMQKTWTLSDPLLASVTWLSPSFT